MDSVTRMAGALLWAASMFFAAACSAAEPPAPGFDLVLENGTVIDGTGAAAFVADVGIRDGRVQYIGDSPPGPARETLDITGRVLAPGFIDVHSHADRALGDPAQSAMPGFLKQGVTTAVYGVDGGMDLETLREYIGTAEREGMGLNFLSYIGHNGVRRAVMGNEARAPRAEELAQMKAMVRQAMELGAAGLSSGLMYLPGNFATTGELVELARVTAPFGGIYDSHVRDPANALLSSHQECLDIALAAGVAAHPAHIKAVGAKNFGLGPELVALVEAGIARGQEVTVDLYPYDGAATLPMIGLLYPADDTEGRRLWGQMTAAMSGESTGVDLAALMEALRNYWQALEPGSEPYASAVRNTESPAEGIFGWVDAVGYQSMRIVVSSEPKFEGRMLTELAAERGLTPFELVREIVVAEGAGAMVTLGAIQEEDLRIVLRQPWAMVSSDGEELNPEHPRGRGTFARLLGRYVREWGVLSLEEAVHKVSGLPARFLKLEDRGVIRAGAVADLVVFDAASIIDTASWAEPGLYAQGVEQVLIGGRFALRDGEPTQQRLGRFVRFQGR